MSESNEYLLIISETLDAAAEELTPEEYDELLTIVSAECDVRLETIE